jgi:hypothetical protein
MQDSFDDSDINRTSRTFRMPRTNDRTARRTAVIGQKGPLFVVADDNDNSYYDWSLQPGQNTKNKCAGTAQDS